MNALIAMVLIAAAITACAAPPQRGPGPGRAGVGENATQARVLTIAIRYEIQRLIPKSYQSGIQENKALFTSSLTRTEGNGSIGAHLAEVPRLNTETWRVFHDRQMETIYRLRPGLTWHDGKPLTADDFVFASQVYTSSSLDVFIRSPQQLI